jgi:membrane protein
LSDAAKPSTSPHPEKQKPAAEGSRERFYRHLSAERAFADLKRLDELSRHGRLKTIRAAFTGFINHNDFLWASGLTYTTSLSLVPILAVALSALKGFGLVGRISPLIERYLAINSPVIAGEILNFVDKINARTLGLVGGITLVITVVLTLSTIEQSLNTIFNVSRGRGWLRAFADYLSLTFTVPLLIAGAVPLKNLLQSYVPDLPGLGWFGALIPVSAAFTFLYLFFPNTNVNWGAAALGGVVAALLFDIGQWAYITFQVSAGQYQAIYGALAAVPILLTWIYVLWVIVLVGAELTAAIQGIEPTIAIDYRSPNFVHVAALLAVFRAGERMILSDAPSCSLHSLSAELGVPETAVKPIIDRLLDVGIIVTAGAPQPGIFLANDPAKMTVAEVFAAFGNPVELSQGEPRVAAMLQEFFRAERETANSVTVKDLVSGHFERTTRRATQNGIAS